MKNPIKWIAEAVSDAWYRLGAWYTVRMWHLFADGEEARLAGFRPPLHDHTHELIVRACTRRASHSGPCNGFPRPGHKVWDEKLGRAVPMTIAPTGKAVPQTIAPTNDKTKDLLADWAETKKTLDKSLERRDEARKERRRMLSRKRYAIAHGKRTFIGFNGVKCHLPKTGKTKASHRTKAR